MRSMLLLLISFIGGYLFVSWLPVPNSLSLNDIILGFVLNPVKVFAATITFFIGTITNGIFIRETVLNLKRTRKKNKGFFILIISILLYFIMLISLVWVGFWEMVLFFSFAIVYGMMTYDKNK
jgi:hypothetical protein